MTSSTDWPSQGSTTSETTLSFKARDQMALVRAMNNIHSRAEEIVLHDLIFA